MSLFPFMDTRTVVSKQTEKEDMSHEEGQKDMALAALQGLATLKENSNV